MGSRRRMVAAAGLAAVLSACSAAHPRSATPGPPVAVPAASACGGRTLTVRLSGDYDREAKLPSPAPGTVVDAREARFNAFPYRALYPFAVGGTVAPAGVCVLGGIVVGRQPRSLTWDQMKRGFDGDGLRIAGKAGYGVDGLRVDNLSDGVAPRGTKDRYPADGDGFVLRNLYFTYIRDDCVENDEIAAGVIADSLFDGCYTGISERPSDGNPQWRYPAPPGETLTLSHVLLRLEAMPGPRGAGGSTRGHGQLFKWSSVANRLVVEHSIFLVEQTPNSTSFFPFPPGTKTVDTVIVWLGAGPFAWMVPPGTTITTDRRVWDEARAGWLERHGCSSFLSCSRLNDPIPSG